MADPAPTYAAWFQSLPIPWLVGGPVGSNDAAAQAAILDGQVARLKLAQKAHMPDYAPVDALPHIGGDRQLEQGPYETNANFVIRLKTAWDDWSRAGQPAELLTQLYWGGFPGAVLVQQNGNAYTLSSSPTAGVDPTPLLVTSTLGLNHQVSGSPPWWYFDKNQGHGSRFAVLFPNGGPAFYVHGTATFTGVEDGVTVPWPTVVWNNTFADTSYKIQVGPAVVADSGGPVVVAADNTTKTTTSVVVDASASFVGTVDCIAYAAGAAPYGPVAPGSNDLARLRRLINRWRPSRALCMGVYVRISGLQWGQFIWGQAGAVWGGTTLVYSV